MMKKLKTLFVDLELSPNVGCFYGRWDIRMSEPQIIVPSYLINYAYKWEGDTDIKVESIWHYKQVRPMDELSDKEIVIKLWELFDEADVVVAFNGKRFDIKKANMFFLKHGLNPPSPYHVIDPMQVAKKNFGFDSNSLASLAIRMGCTFKQDSGGIMSMYKATIGDREAQKHIDEYCKGDVQTMYEIYHKMFNWNNSHVNISENCSCSRCGSHDLQKRGRATTRSGASSYQRYKCNSCGKWNKGDIIRLTTEERNVKFFPLNN